MSAKGCVINLNHSFLESVDSIFFQILEINDFQTLFLIAVAIVITKPLEKSTLYLSFLQSQLIGLSRGTVISTYYFVFALFGWVFLEVYHPSLKLGSKLLTTALFPAYVYTMVIFLFLAIKYIALFVGDILRFVCWLFNQFFCLFSKTHEQYAKLRRPER